MSAAVFTKMAALAGCLKTELNAEGFSECRLIVTAAESLDLSSDLSDGDIAWVSLVRAEPNLSIDFEGGAGGTPCKIGYLYRLLVGHVTCYPIEEDPLGDDVMLEVTERQTRAMVAARKAVTCCSWAGRQSVVDVDGWTPIFEGGMVGGQWEVTLG